MSQKKKLLATDVTTATREAHLHYVSDHSPGIRRKKKGKAFVYISPTGKLIKNAPTIKRIHALVIPPAWTDVWICPDAHGHIQATGMDNRGRKQYRYHAQWRAVRDRTKFDKLQAFGKHLPAIRKQVAQDMKKPGLPRQKVLAAIVRVLDLTHLRIGNEEYAEENHSYGITTLHDKHVSVKGKTVRFRFKGKSGQHQDVHFEDKKMAAIMKQCEELPGHELFGYIDDNGKTVDIGSHDVNEYLHTITGHDITAKDFRTWGGTIHAAVCLFHAGECDTELRAKQCMTEVIKEVAAFLGNRPATCKKYYIDPRIFSAYNKRILCHSLSNVVGKKAPKNGLLPMEKAVMNVLKTATYKREK